VCLVVWFCETRTHPTYRSAHRCVRFDQKCFHEQFLMPLSALRRSFAPGRAGYRAIYRPDWTLATPLPLKGPADRAPRSSSGEAAYIDRHVN
jgi:hypothetical protein